MSLNINSFMNNYSNYGSYTSSQKKSTINKNSAQYKAAAKDFLAEHRRIVAAMTPEERMVYEMLGGEDAYMKNVMTNYDSDGNLLNAYGVAGMDATGKSLSEMHQMINVSEEYRQKMFDLVKREFIREKGIANGDTTNRSSVFTEYQKSINIDDRLKGTWSLGQYEKQYNKAFYDAVKAADPEWKPGQSFNTSILKAITRESVESTLVISGNTLVKKTVDYSV